jgi:hypothetical protein
MRGLEGVFRGKAYLYLEDASLKGATAGPKDRAFPVKEIFADGASTAASGGVLFQIL